jgi:hypothetical protein
MASRSQLADDPACPLPFIVISTFASALIWLLAVLGYLPLP